MRRRAIWYGLVVIMVVIGWVSGMLIQAARIEAREQQAVQTVWSKQCAGNRVVITNTFMVRCVLDSPTPTYRPTPSPAPTEKP